jgi:hypothetical protein
MTLITSIYNIFSPNQEQVRNKEGNIKIMEDKKWHEITRLKKLFQR